MKEIYYDVAWKMRASQIKLVRPIILPNLSGAYKNTTVSSQ